MYQHEVVIIILIVEETIYIDMIILVSRGTIPALKVPGYKWGNLPNFDYVDPDLIPQTIFLWTLSCNYSREDF